MADFRSVRERSDTGTRPYSASQSQRLPPTTWGSGSSCGAPQPINDDHVQAAAQAMRMRQQSNVSEAQYRVLHGGGGGGGGGGDGSVASASGSNMGSIAAASCSNVSSIGHAGRSAVKSVVKQGWLTKLGGASGTLFSRETWKKRWMVLDGVRLTWAESEKALPKGEVFIRGATISEMPPKSKHGDYAFAVRHPERTLYARAASYDEQQAWINALRSVAGGGQPADAGPARPPMVAASSSMKVDATPPSRPSMAAQVLVQPGGGRPAEQPPVAHPSVRPSLCRPSSAHTVPHASQRPAAHAPSGAPSEVGNPSRRSQAVVR